MWAQAAGAKLASATIPPSAPACSASTIVSPVPGSRTKSGPNCARRVACRAHVSGRVLDARDVRMSGQLDDPFHAKVVAHVAGYVVDQDRDRTGAGAGGIVPG